MTPDGVARLHAEHGPGLFLFARAVTRDDHLAEDALQATFLRLLEAGDPPNRAYLYASVRNTALNLVRSRVRAGRRDRACGLERPLFEEPSGPFSDRETIEAALLDLPDEQREVVVLKIWNEMTFSEIGDALGVSANTASSRYRYALEKLRRSLSEVTGP